MCQKLERSNQLIWGYHADILVRLGYIIYKNLIRFLGVSENGGIVQETKTYSNMFVSKTLWIWHTLISWPSNQMSYVEWWESIGNFSEEPMRFWHLKESSNRNGWTWIAQYFKPREPQILPLIWGSVPESKLASRIIDQKNEPRRVTKKLVWFARKVKACFSPQANQQNSLICFSHLSPLSLLSVDYTPMFNAGWGAP